MVLLWQSKMFKITLLPEPNPNKNKRSIRCHCIYLSCTLSFSLLFIKFNHNQVIWSKTPSPCQTPFTLSGSFSVPSEKKLDLGGYGVSRGFVGTTFSLISPQPRYSCSACRTFPDTSSEIRGQGTERADEQGLRGRGMSCQGKGGDQQSFRWRGERVVQGEGRWAHLGKDSAVWKEKRQAPTLKSSPLQIQRV